MDLIKFDPSIEELQKIVAATSAIVATDLTDEAQLVLVHDTRISLRDARVKIEKAGKEYRAEALKYQKDVIAREKELIAIIEPEEIRLKAIEEEATAMKERAARAALLPMRREQLDKFGPPTVADESILDMDNDQFITYLNERTAQKNEQDRLAIEAEKAALAHAAELAKAAEDAKIAERARIEAEQRANEERRVQEAARAQNEAAAAAQKLIDDARAEAERIAREAQERLMQAEAQAAAAAHEKFAREQQAKDEAAQAEAMASFRQWTLNFGYEEVTGNFETRHTREGIELWKRVGVYTNLI